MLSAKVNLRSLKVEAEVDVQNARKNLAVASGQASSEGLPFLRCACSSASGSKTEIESQSEEKHCDGGGGKDRAVPPRAVPDSLEHS